MITKGVSLRAGSSTSLLAVLAPGQDGRKSFSERTPRSAKATTDGGFFENLRWNAPIRS